MLPKILTHINLVGLFSEREMRELLVRDAKFLLFDCEGVGERGCFNMGPIVILFPP